MFPRLAFKSPTEPTEKAIEISLNGLYLCRQLPTLPHTFACSTIGPAGLNLRRFCGRERSGEPAAEIPSEARDLLRTGGRRHVRLDICEMLSRVLKYCVHAIMTSYSMSGQEVMAD